MWGKTRAFFLQRDPSQVERAEKDPKHKLALVFRSYLGQASRWANAGVADRVLDYQVWCGPAMGAFNEWAQGGFLPAPENRRVATVARNILYGAAVLSRSPFSPHCQGGGGSAPRPSRSNCSRPKSSTAHSTNQGNP